MTSPLDPATIEECARWHDAQHADWKRKAANMDTDSASYAAASINAEMHKRSAAAIRALPSSPPGWRDIANKEQG